MSEAERLHEEACTRGKNTYIDPETRLTVLTEHYLLSRGYCCGNGCRHCPYIPRHGGGSNMPQYQRVILKVSGEALKGKDQIFGRQRLEFLADEIRSVYQSVQLAIVIGGGNIVRGP